MGLDTYVRVRKHGVHLTLPVPKIPISKTCDEIETKTAFVYKRGRNKKQIVRVVVVVVVVGSKSSCCNGGVIYGICARKRRERKKER